MIPSPPPASAPLPLWRRLLPVAAWLALALHFVQPVSTVLSPDLDSSIHASYAYFTAHGFQFGPEVNTTAGPYGFLAYGWDYSGELFWTQWALMLAFGLALSALTGWFIRAARTGWTRWLWLAGLLFAVPGGDTLFMLPALLVGAFFLLSADRPVSRLALAAAAALLALTALTKGTALFVAVAVLGVTGLQSLWRREAARFGFIAGNFLLALLGWWIAAGQNPLHFPAYVNGLRHIASGYNEAMFIDEPPARLRDGLLLAGALAGTLGWLALRHRTHRTLLPLALLLAGLGFIAWKHGFVRADGHVLIFFDFALVLVLTVPLAEQLALGRPLRPAAGLAGLTLVALALNVAAADRLIPQRTRSLATSFGERWLAHARFAFLPATIRTEFAARLAAARAQHALPATAARVGRRSIDFFGHDFGLLLLAGLNYRPAPMCCGTYVVYNRHFKDLNAAHFVSPRRPDFVLLSPQTIDNRWLTGDDSLSFLALLSHYRPVLRDRNLPTEADLLLLAASPPPPAPTQPRPAARPLGTRVFRLGESLPVPAVGDDELLLFSIHAPPSLRGRLRGVFYKPALLTMDVEGDGLEAPLHRRIIPSSLAAPTLLSPAVERVDDVIALYARQPGKTVRALRFHTDRPDTFATDRFTVSFSVLPRPAPLAPDELAQPYPTGRITRPPDAFAPDELGPWPYQGRYVRYLHAPATLTYDLRGDERVFTAVLGLDEGAYQQGRTDGVDFIFELLTPDRAAQTLYRTNLRPMTVPADRGLHAVRVVLPPWFPPGSQFRLRSDPGPSGDKAWDWAFVSSADLQRGPLLLEQFPGFRSPPASVGPHPLGAMGDGNRDVLMLGPPASVEFALTGHATRLAFTAGILPGSYQNGGHTDGVDFIAELLFADGSVRPVGALVLRPTENPSDRGDRSVTLPLPPHTAAERLRLRATPGPADDLAWDWSYLSSLNIE